MADRLGQRSVLAIGTPGAPGGIYDQYLGRRATEAEASDAASYLLAQYRQGRERLDSVTLSPQQQPDQFPDRMRCGDGPWIPCRVVGFDPAAGGESTVVSGWRSWDGRLHLDRESRDPSPLELMRHFEVTFESARFRGAMAALGPVVASAGRAMRDLRDALDPELEAAKNWPAQGSTCAHVCGPDPGHVCDARAATAIRHPLPSGGTRTLPLCRPCAEAEHAAEVGS